MLPSNRELELSMELLLLREQAVPGPSKFERAQKPAPSKGNFFLK
jgi:hypothetical protein